MHFFFALGNINGLLLLPRLINCYLDSHATYWANYGFSSVIYDVFSVTRLYSADDRVTSE
jgi:hypothetical protein